MMRRGYSLLRVLFVSMVALAFVLLVVMQFVEAGRPEAPPPTAAERLTVQHWLGELVPVLIMVATTTGSIWLTLQYALRPMRRLSRRAGAIGPDNLNERLPLIEAPKEIAPLVEAFNASLDRLETAWAAQRAFSSNAAHELRMPLATLRAHVESLLPASERQIATAEFDRLARVIEQLLFLAEADQDHLTRHDRFNLVALARDAAMAAAPRVLARGYEISFDSEVDDHECHGDPTLVGIALRNLIDNAHAHTPKGTHIAVNISADGVVTVSDDGPGVPEAFENRLFERFTRSDPKGDGAGLGLSIASRVMTLHSGRIWYERRPAGSAFNLAFP